jgi:hypothetical protein
MASNDYDIVNLALTRLGAKTITALNDGSNNATAANVIYSDTLSDMLRIHQWGFATKTANLTRGVANVLTVTGVTQADPGVVTYTGTDPENGDRYLCASIVGMTELNSNYYIISNVNTSGDTFELQDENGLDVDTSGYTAWSSGGTFTQQNFQNETHAYTYDLPSDIERALWINDDPTQEYEITKEGLHTDQTVVELTYIANVTTVNAFTTDFVDMFAWKLASELAVKITGSMKKSDWAEKRYQIAKSKATTVDAKQEHSERNQENFNKYKNARR